MMNKNNAGLILGTFLGTLHLIWAILVATGIAQPLMDFVFKLHFLNNPHRVGQFEIVTALELILVTFIIGYIAGWFLSFLWEKVHGKK